jgi:hypothetical protein
MSYLSTEFLLEDKTKITNINKLETTFNNYKKKEVINQLEGQLKERSIPMAIYWAVELHCSGFLEILIHKLYDYWVKYINIANLDLIPHWKRLMNILAKIDRKILKQGSISLINNQVIRNEICYLIVGICISNIRILNKLPTIDDFNMGKYRYMLISRDLNYINRFLRTNDPKDIKIPCSEIGLQLLRHKSDEALDRCCFWLAWLYNLEKKFYKKGLKCAIRTIETVDSNFLDDWVWLIWEIIFDRRDENNEDVIEQLFSLFKSGYTKGSKRSKLDLIIMAFSVIINPIPSIRLPPIGYNEEEYCKIVKFVSNINYVYLDVFQNKQRYIWAVSSGNDSVDL